MKIGFLIIFDAILLLALVGLDYLAFKNHLYWKIWWFDKPMHFLGGWCLALAGVIIFQFISFKLGARPLSAGEMLFASFLPALIIGGFWEFFEFTADKFYIAKISLKTLVGFENGWRGSLNDLSFDLLGAVFNFLLFRMVFLMKKNG